MNRLKADSSISVCLYTIGALFTTLQGYAQQDLDARISQLETDMKKVRGQTAFGNFGAKTASAFPQIDGYGLFFTADFLWWKLYEFQTDFAFHTKSSSTLFKGNIAHMNFDWEPGLRVGLGYIFDYDGWDVSLNFTTYRTEAHGSRRDKDGALYPLIGYSAGALQRMKMEWNVQFNALDLNLGRNYFISRYLSFHPIVGITSAWIDQHRHSLKIPYNIKLRGENNFWGIGPRIGCDAQFFLGRNFSFYGNIAGALLWGDFHIKQRELSKPLQRVYSDAHFNTHRMAPMANFGLGLAFETNFNRNTAHFLIKIGYENQYWWKQNQFPIINPVTQSQQRVSDDLGMQGLTANVRFDF